MPTHPTDRFDELPTDSRRVGAHRAEQPRLRRGRVLLWAAIATVALIGVGIVGTLWAGGRFGAAPGSSAAPTSAVTADPVVDTAYAVLVLNATPQEGLSSSISADIVAAGWAAEDVTAGDAGSQDFEKTTVFFANEEDEGAARGLAQAIGGAEVERSEAYQDAGDESLQQLVLVIGLDRVDEGTPTD